MKKMYNKILVYRCGALGDTIVALPTLNALRRNFPQAVIYIMTQSNQDGKVWSNYFFKDTTFVDGCITYKNSEIKSVQGIYKIIKKIRSYEFDLVVYLSNDKNSGLRILRDKLFFYFSAQCKRIFSTSRKVDFWGNINTSVSLYPKESIRLLKTLSQIGINEDIFEFNLPITKEHVKSVNDLFKKNNFDQSKTLIAVCPGSKMLSKMWPIERYRELGLKLINNFNAYLVIVGGESDKETGKILKKHWPENSSVLAAGEMDIMESAELLQRCLFYVGNDTGAMHLSAAVDTPCVAIFSSRDMPESWYPWGEEHIIVRNKTDCEGCFLEKCPTNECINNISETEVYEACKKMLKKTKRKTI